MFKHLLLEDKNFIDEFTKELGEIWKDIGDFFVGIKEITYDPLVSKFGEMPVNLLGIGIIVVLIMVILLKIINR